jgi:hypothetical protein
MATVELSVDANLQGLRQQLESIKGITAEQAKAMAAELNKSIKASERAAKQAADASKRAMEQARASATGASEAVNNLGDKFGKAGSNSAKLAGALGMVNPGLADAARNIADLADVGEVGASFGELGVIVGAAGAVVALFAAGLAPLGELFAENARRAEEAATSIEAFAAASESAGNAAEGLTGLLRSANDEIKIKTGLETAEDQAVRKKTEALYASVDALAAQYEAENTAAQQVLDSTRTEYGLLGAKVMTNKATEEEAKRYAELGVQVNAATKTLATNTAAVDRARVAAKGTAEVLADLAKAEQVAKARAEAAAKAREAAAKRQAAAEKASTDAIKAAEQAVKDAETEYAATQKRLEEAAAHRAAMEKEANDKAVASYEGYAAQLERLVPSKPLSDIEQLTQLIVDLDVALLKAPTEEVGRRFATMSATAVAALEDMKAKQEEAFALERLEAFSGQLDKITQVFGVLTEASAYFSEKSTEDYRAAVDARDSLGKKATKAERDAANERVDTTRKAAIKAFMVDKALKVAQAITATALAATQALATFPAPNFFAAGLAAAAGAINVARISSEKPSFHKGGFIGQPDESMAVVRSGEAVLNPMGRSALGDDTIRAANAGNLRGSDGGAVQIVYKHKAFDYFIRDHLRTRATLPRALGRGGRLGQAGG